MKQPIIVDTSLNFVLIGSILNSDGIIVQSKNTDLELVGFAHHIYRLNEEFTNDDGIISILRDEKINYMWSESFMQMRGRNNRFLFCWKSVQMRGESFGIFQMRRSRSYILKSFDRFLEDTYSELRSFMLNETNNHNINEKIKWNISPFLLQCYYKENLHK
jgi:hypothetical protein